jgi:hypothetical protein
MVLSSQTAYIIPIMSCWTATMLHMTAYSISNSRAEQRPRCWRRTNIPAVPNLTEPVAVEHGAVNPSIGRFDDDQGAGGIRMVLRPRRSNALRDG